MRGNDRTRAGLATKALALALACTMAWGVAPAMAAAGDDSDTDLQPVVKVATKRLSGATRYDTMASIVKEGFAAGKWAVVASGKDFPDALCASAVAGAHGCPVILTDSKKISAQAEAELKRLGVNSVLIVGGTGSVSKDVEMHMDAMSIGVDRVAGTDRIDTSVAVLGAARKAGSTSNTVIVATGDTFADALAVGPWSWYTGSPIVLAMPHGLLTDAAVKAIKDDGHFSRVLLVGGTDSVSDGVRAQLGDGFEYVRQGGKDRYATSSAIAEWSCWHGLTWLRPQVATGKSFPDALAGAALGGILGSPLLLADAASSPSITTLGVNKQSISGAYVLGGTSAIDNSVYNAVVKAVQ